MQFWISVTLCSETCLASGMAQRSGDVDMELETDPDTGLPVLRGRVLKGLIVEELALILNAFRSQPTAGTWRAAAETLFGVPGTDSSGLLHFSDGALASDAVAMTKFRIALEGKKRWTAKDVRDALSLPRHQTRIDEKTGAAAARSLRSARLWRTGLQVLCRVESPRPLTGAEQALAAASAVAVRRIGLHRNRGWGLVRVRVLDESQQDVTAKWMDGMITMQPGSSEEAAPTEEPSPSVLDATPQRAVVSYELTLAAPVILATAGPETSSMDTLRYIPGSTMLGAMARRFLDANPALGKTAAQDGLFHHLFLSNGTRWLNAYSVNDGRCLLPVPTSFSVPKNGDGRTVWDKAAAAFDPADAPQWQPYAGTGQMFIRLLGDNQEEDSGQMFPHQPSLTVRLHHQRNRDMGRPEDANVFSYVSLDAGQRFAGHVLCESKESAERVVELLQGGPVRLGRSRTATYGGLAQISKIVPSQAEHWQETTERPVMDGNRTTVTLLSDCIGLTGEGQPDPRAILDEVRRAMGLPSDAAPKTAFLKFRDIGGYVGTWHMPRPRETALAAGSVFVFSQSVPDRAALQHALWTGLGQRRQEGFGRFAVNWHGRISQWQVTAFPPPASPAKPQGDPSAGLLLLQKNILRRRLAAQLVSKANELASAVANVPPAALVARLRVNVSRSSSRADIRQFLANARGKQAGRQLLRARIGSKTLFHWLVGLCQMESDQPGWLGTLQIPEFIAEMGANIDLLDAGDHETALRFFLDAFCEHLRRRSVRARKSASEKQEVGQ